MSRIVHQADALKWLTEVDRASLRGCSFITSLPDASEFPTLSLEEWKSWFIAAARLVLSSTPDEGVAIFYQTDLKKDGAWVDKGFLVQKAAEAEAMALLWHKVVCKAPAGQITYGRPAYAHMLCFSRSVRAEIARSSADVLPRAGEVTWTRGMGLEACLHACKFVLEQTLTRTIVDPFCGHGTVLLAANSLGLSAVGVELSAKRAKKARGLTFESLVQPDSVEPEIS